MLKNLARKGKTVISTIHQPSSESFSEFDRLLLLSDGQAVYQGEAKQSAKYFRQLGFHMPRFCNPTDVYMRILAVNYPKDKVDIEKLKYLDQAYIDKMTGQVQEQNALLELSMPDVMSVESTNASFF